MPYSCLSVSLSIECPPMARLIYSSIASLDGYVADEQGEFGWSMPDREVHSFVNGLERGVGTYLYGRRMYEVMKVWEADEAIAGPTADAALLRDYAELWRAADKVVYSRTLEDISTARTKLEPRFDPQAVRRLKEEAERDLGIGGPELATQALEADLVDEVQLFLVPVAVGAGKPALPVALPFSLNLLDQRRFGNGTVYLRYGVAGRGD
jgi:dihydrofolate reductase